MSEVRRGERRIQFSKRGRQPYNINTQNTLLEEIINVLGRWNSPSRLWGERTANSPLSSGETIGGSYCIVQYSTARRKSLSIRLWSGSLKLHACNANYANEYSSWSDTLIFGKGKKSVDHPEDGIEQTPLSEWSRRYGLQLMRSSLSDSLFFCFPITLFQFCPLLFIMAQRRSAAHTPQIAT